MLPPELWGTCQDSPQPTWSSTSPDSEISIRDWLNSQTNALQQAPTSPSSTVAVPDIHEPAGSPAKTFSESLNSAPSDHLEPPASPQKQSVTWSGQLIRRPDCYLS